MNFLITKWFKQEAKKLFGQSIAILKIYSLLCIVSVVQAESDYWSVPIVSNTADKLDSNLLIDSLLPESCGLCHIPQFEQWKTSLHAHAAGSGVLGQLPLFDQQTSIDCLNCHAPRIEQQKSLLSGKTTPQHGVDCASCHIRHQQSYGPRPIQITPHGKLTEEPLFKESLFCGSCHQFGEDAILVNGKPLENTLEEWKTSRYAAEKKTCQACHMPDKAHTFKGVHDPDFVRTSLSVEAIRTNSTLTITLTNQGAGHALPTYITPRLRIIWIGDDGNHQVMTVIQRKMDWKSETGWSELFDTRLMPDEIRNIITTLTINNSGYIEVWVDPDADYYDRVYPAILEAMSEESAPDTAINQIEEAMDAASKSSYRLLQLRCETGVKRECL
ncbi:MAG: hypothetical protein HOM14_06190 [Gammaproteobacteria bacterium]|nr:hypothetical protein [Gammaproteobacteria bacterium]MBT3722896.1 hypothetical protein [Gammaproteobacteria bacterium]MBT4077762.1 hypothetical protein [Gammaproteobacteria bacterium]MBT4194432.1 hypothetical protein [Gammaproteobacteria bacterium]MBT4450454.1 hypothetical protein [Gammaproteobacteria bacterium]